MTTIAMNDAALAFPAAHASKARRWGGRILTGLPVLFLAFDVAIKLAHPQFVTEANVRLGYPDSSVFGLGIVLLTCLVLYLVPRTAILGAVLLTGYLGGAIATHVRIGDPLLSHVLFPIYLAVFLWGGLYLRDGRLRGVLGRPVRA
jgi:DoxX-like family